MVRRGFFRACAVDYFVLPVRAPCVAHRCAHLAAVVVGRVSDLCVAGCVTHEGPWFRILKVYVETLREAFVRRSYL